MTKEKQRIETTPEPEKVWKKVGRPPKWGDDVYDKIQEAASMDCTLAEIALFAGISTKTLCLWMKDKKVGDGKEQTLGERIEELRTHPMLKARRTIIDGLSTTDGARWYAERKASKEFSAKSTLDANISGNISLIELFNKAKETNDG